MSVDNRIVRMKFDNAQFEANVSKSMSTLDKLKEKLKFTETSKDVSKLQTDIDSISFKKLADNVDFLSNRFSTMGIVGMNVINKLTDGAINAAKRIEQATLGQIRSGGWSRAMNLANAQFMVEGLKLDWETLLKAIDYGVQDTAYGLDAAAKAASSLAASGVGFKESVKGANDSLMHTSLRAISGVAAMTNSTYEDISRIFTTVAGNGRLMGDQLIQLSSRGLNVAADLGKALHKSEAEVREMVSKGKIDFKTFAKAMDDAFGEHAKDANKTFSGSLSNLKAALSRIGAIFATPVIEKTNIAFNAMTKRVNEVKNALSDLKDEKGAVIQARFATHFAEMWESAMNVTVKAINAIDLSWFQKLADAADNATVRLKGFFDYINGKFGNAEEEVKEATKGTSKATKELILTQKEYDAAHFIMFGKRSYSLSGYKRKKWVEEQGLSYAAVQGYINKVVAAGWDESKVTMKIADSTDNLADSASDAGKEIANATKEASRHENALLIFKHIGNSIKNVFTNVKLVIGAVKAAFSDVFDFTSFLRKTEKFTGKIERLTKALILSNKTVERIRIVFTVFFSAIKLGITIVSTFVGFIMDIVSGFFIAKGAVDDMTASVDKSIGFFDSLFLIFKKIGEGLKTYADNFEELLRKIGQTKGVQRLKDALVGLFGVAKKGVDGAVRPARKEFAKFAESFEMPSIDDVANAIGWIADKIAWFIEHIPIWIDAIKDFVKEVIDKGQEVINWIQDKGQGLIDWVKKQDFAKTIKSSFTDGLTLDDSTKEKIISFFDGMVDFIKDTIANLDWSKIKEAGRIAIIAAILFNSARMLYQAANMFKAIAGMTKSIGGFFKGLNKTLSAIPKALNMASLGFIIGQISGFVAALATLILIVGNMPMDDVLQALFAIGVLAFIISKMFKYIAETIPKEGGKVYQFNIGPYVGMALFVAGLGIGIKLIIDAIKGVMEVVNKPVPGTQNAKGKGGKVAGGFGLFNGLVVVGVIMAGITAMAILLMREVAKQSVFGSFDIQTSALAGLAVMIFAIGLAMKGIVKAMKIMQGISVGTIMLGLLTLGTVFGGMWLLMQSVAKLEKGLAWTAAGIMITFTLAMSLLLTKVMILSIFGWDRIWPALVGIAGITAAMVAIMFVIYKTLSKTQDVKGIALTVLAMGVTIYAIAQSLKLVMTTLKGFENQKTAFTALKYAIIGLAGILIALGGIVIAFITLSKNTDDLLIAAGAFLMMAGSVLMISMALTKLSKVKISKGPIITLLALLAAFFAMGFAASKLDGFAEGIFAIGVSFLSLGAGLILAGAGLFLIGKAFPIFADGFSKMVDVIVKHPVAATVVILGLVAACYVMNKALTAVIKVLELLETPIKALIGWIKKLKDKLHSKEDGKKGGLFGSLLEKLENGGKKFLAWFKKQTPLMKAGIIAFATMMMGTIIELAPMIARTILESIFSIINVLITYMDAIVNRLLAFLIKLISALANAISKNSGAIVRALGQVFKAIVVLVARLLAGIVRGIAGWFGKDDVFGIASTLDSVADSYAEDVDKMAKETDKDLEIMNKSFKDTKQSIDDQYGSVVDLRTEYDELAQKTNDLAEAQNNYNDALAHGQTHSVEWYRQKAEESGEKSWFQEEQNAVTKYLNLMDERKKVEEEFRSRTGTKGKNKKMSEDEIQNALYAWDLAHEVSKAQEAMDKFNSNYKIFNENANAQERTLMVVAETYKGLFGEDLDISKYGTKEWDALVKQQPEILNILNRSIATNLVAYEAFKDKSKDAQRKMNEDLLDSYLEGSGIFSKDLASRIVEYAKEHPVSKEVQGLAAQYAIDPDVYRARYNLGDISEDIHKQAAALAREVTYNTGELLGIARLDMEEKIFDGVEEGLTDADVERVKSRLLAAFTNLDSMPSDVIGGVIEYILDKDAYNADLKIGAISNDLNERVLSFIYNSLYGYEIAAEKIASGGPGAAIATNENLIQYLQKIPAQYRAWIIQALVDKEGFSKDTSHSSEIKNTVLEYVNRLLGLDYHATVSPDKIFSDMKPYLDSIESATLKGTDFVSNAMAKRMEEKAKDTESRMKGAIEDTAGDIEKDNFFGPMANTVKSEMEGVSNYGIEGFIGPLEDTYNRNRLVIASTKFISALPESARRVLNEHSPSKVMETIGSFATEGLIIGLKDKASGLKDTATEMISGLVSQFSEGGTDVTSAFTSMLGGNGGDLLSAVSGGYQFDMGIQPVLDASSIMNGTDSIGSMLGNQSLMIDGFSGQLAADITSLDSRNSQGVNEIRQLRNEMSEMSSAIQSMRIYLDTGALVGGIVDPMDNRLGARAIYARRGN